MDFFTVPTVRFSVLYVYFVLSHDRRQILHFNVTEHGEAGDGGPGGQGGGGGGQCSGGRAGAPGPAGPQGDPGNSLENDRPGVISNF